MGIEPRQPDVAELNISPQEWAALAADAQSGPPPDDTADGNQSA